MRPSSRILFTLAILVISGRVLSESVSRFAMAVNGRLHAYLTSAEQWNGDSWTSASNPTQIAPLVALFIGIFLLSWASGFLLRRALERGTWLAALLFYLVVNNAYLVLIGSVRLGSVHAPPPFWFLIDIVLPRWISTWFVFVVPMVGGLLASGRKRNYLVSRQPTAT